MTISVLVQIASYILRRTKELQTSDAAVYDAEGILLPHRCRPFPITAIANNSFQFGAKSRTLQMVFFLTTLFCACIKTVN